jgi:hypothetical protein
VSSAGAGIRERSETGCGLRWRLLWARQSSNVPLNIRRERPDDATSSRVRVWFVIIEPSPSAAWLHPDSTGVA